jgi:hypothetical protein
MAELLSRAEQLEIWKVQRDQKKNLVSPTKERLKNVLKCKSPLAMHTPTTSQSFPTKKAPVDAPSTPLRPLFASPMKASRVIKPVQITATADEKKEEEGLGSVALLTPVRVNSRVEAFIGSSHVLTPVRRSARKGARSGSSRTIEQLEETNFAYFPNQYLGGD